MNNDTKMLIKYVSFLRSYCNSTTCRGGCIFHEDGHDCPFHEFITDREFKDAKDHEAQMLVRYARKLTNYCANLEDCPRCVFNLDPNDCILDSSPCNWPIEEIIKFNESKGD